MISALASEHFITANYHKRIYPISRITIHCACSTAKHGITVARYTDSVGVSTHYAIGSSGDICSMVDERFRAWCTGNSPEGVENDHKTVNIECCQSKLTPDYPCTEATYESLINLCVDICYRNGIKRLIVGETLTAHRWYAIKSCPGDWLYTRFEQICNEVNKMLEKIEQLENEIKELKKKHTEYNWYDALPEWAKPTYAKLDKMHIKLGKEDGQYHHSEDMVKMLVMLDKLGVIH